MFLFNFGKRNTLHFQRANTHMEQPLCQQALPSSLPQSTAISQLEPTEDTDLHTHRCGADCVSQSFRHLSSSPAVWFCCPYPIPSKASAAVTGSGTASCTDAATAMTLRVEASALYLQPGKLPRPLPTAWDQSHRRPAGI